MLADLDTLMRYHSIDAIVVSMHEAMHASFRWLTRGASVTRGYAIKRAGEAPLLVHYPMERDEAAATGLATRSVHDFGYHEIFKAQPVVSLAYAEFFDQMFREIGIHGPVGFFGNLPIHLYLDAIEELERRGWAIHRSAGDDLIQRARKRKDAREIENVASVGRRTEEVLEGVREILRTARIEGDLAHRNGEVLTLGALKSIVSSEIARLGMVEDHETILSQGRDAAIPHSRGDGSAPVRASLPIVLDIFPADRASGYFFDLTRTFCIGRIPPRLEKIHNDVLDAFELSAKTMRAGTRAATYQKRVCEFFEERGYPTIESAPATETGYVHSLGHGVGLDIHERPFFSTNPANHDEIEAGDVLTIEPGLYFPGEEIGVRIEDTLCIDEQGRAITFCASDRGLEP